MTRHLRNFLFLVIRYAHHQAHLLAHQFMVAYRFTFIVVLDYCLEIKHRREMMQVPVIFPYTLQISVDLHVLVLGC